MGSQPPRADGRVVLLITVDKDLLTLGAFEGIDIVKPSEFPEAD